MSFSCTYWLVCCLCLGKVSEVVEFVISLQCQVLHHVVQLFDSQLDAFTANLAHCSVALSHIQSVNITDEQKIPEMLLASAEMMDRFKKILVTSVDFVLFSG